jgi:soluble lytic murein transglycosylase-like protein
MPIIIFILLLALVSSSAIAAPPVRQIEPTSASKSQRNQTEWLNAMSKRLEVQIPDQDVRTEFLKVVHAESIRVQLNPQLVLSLIDIASGFKKYAVSTEGARGYMQVMPSWVKKMGVPDRGLFGLRENIRYGCVILQYFLDQENGDALKALGRYRNQMGGEIESQPVASLTDFPEAVELLSKTRWRYDDHSVSDKD